MCSWSTVCGCGCVAAPAAGALILLGRRPSHGWRQQMDRGAASGAWSQEVCGCVSTCLHTYASGRTWVRRAAQAVCKGGCPGGVLGQGATPGSWEWPAFGAISPCVSTPRGSQPAVAAWCSRGAGGVAAKGPGWLGWLGFPFHRRTPSVHGAPAAASCRLGAQWSLRRPSGVSPWPGVLGVWRMGAGHAAAAAARGE